MNAFLAEKFFAPPREYQAVYALALEQRHYPGGHPPGAGRDAPDGHSQRIHHSHAHGFSPRGCGRGWNPDT